MKIFLDLFPILIFFTAYKFFGIYVATAAAIAASIIQVGYFWFKFRRIELMQGITFVILVVLGSATLLAHNPMFIKWKPTVIYWIFATIFTVSQFVGDKPFIQRLMEKTIALPKAIWRKLNLSWILFFSTMGGINLIVVYNCSTNVWVNFKLFGFLGSTLIFGILQSLYIAKKSEKN